MSDQNVPYAALHVFRHGVSDLGRDRPIVNAVKVPNYRKYVSLVARRAVHH